jgi:hypothetical protein
LFLSSLCCSPFPVDIHNLDHGMTHHHDEDLDLGDGFGYVVRSWEFNRLEIVTVSAVGTHQESSGRLILNLLMSWMHMNEFDRVCK